MALYGIKGWVKVEVHTDFPERFDPGSFLLLEGEPIQVLESNWHKTQVRLHLQGYESPEASEALIGQWLRIRAEDRPELDEDEFYSSELLGMTVVDDSGRERGQVDNILFGAANDLLSVGGVLIPIVHEFVLEIDRERRTIVVRAVDGLFEEEN